MESFEKTGYLNSDFKIFHLTDQTPREFNYHFHDFNKIILFISGNVSYFIEGKSYQLKPYDIILVKAGEIHKPIIHDVTPYERIIIYISADFIKAYRRDNYDLTYCFAKAEEYHSNVLRMAEFQKEGLYDTCNRLEQSFNDDGYASKLYQKVLFLEFMISLNRVVLNKSIDYIDTNIANVKILNIIKYINEHLRDDISIDSIADIFFLNRSYLMHLFKAETGYTIGKYITEKRLFMAKNLIKNGSSITNACYNSGFKNYATFFRAFKEKFHISPKDVTDFL
jgi:AraC-like DNA-binding protein